MQVNKESGFSLIELLLVVVVIGVIATIAIPQLQKGITAAENQSAYTTLKMMVSSELSLYTKNGRFARLDEINEFHQNALGISGSDGSLKRGKFTFEMDPDYRTNAQLRDGYKISATRTVGASDLPYRITIDGTGVIVQELP